VFLIYQLYLSLCINIQFIEGFVNLYVIISNIFFVVHVVHGLGAYFVVVFDINGIVTDVNSKES
jgi:hypothetical protein